MGKRYGGLWEFPGGEVLHGEFFLDAARRGLREELGIEIEAIGQVRLSVHDPGSEFVIHIVDAAVNGASQSLEHADVAWVEGRLM